MEALYGDLENYNEVNIVEELRNENKVLKLKLEEYETAIGKLQKDYDKLVLDFNNLQNNYSSLLKTARAEVERKTQMITQLNIDKDIMVLKNLQNGNNRRLQYRIPNKKVNEKSIKETEKSNVAKKMKPESSINKNNKCKTNVSSNIAIPESANKSALNEIDKGKIEESLKYELKENVESLPRTSASSIKNRRKSMPASNLPRNVIDDSDLESDRSGSKLKTEVPPKETCKTTGIKDRLLKMSCDRLSNTASDAVSLSGLSSHSHETVRDENRSEISKNNEKPRDRECDVATEQIEDAGNFSDSDKFRDRMRESERLNDKIGGVEKYRESGKLRDNHRYKNDMKDVVQAKKNEKYREGDHFRESDKYRDDRFKEIHKYREDNRFKEGDRYKENKYRDEMRLRESEKFRDSDKTREVEKINEYDKYGESDNRSRHSDRYRMGDRHRDSDKYRENDKYGDRYRQDDKNRMIDKYRESGKFNESDRYSYTDRYKNKDKFDPSYRHRRYSPDRPTKRNFRDLQDDRLHRAESPPSELRSLPHHRSHDRQIIYEGHTNSSDKYKHPYDHDPLSLSEAQAEPCRKRQKLEHAMHVVDDRRYHDRPAIKPSCSNEYDILHASCQSPDAVFSPDPYVDTPVTHTVREIKNTSSTPLDDPRITSKRYVLNTENGITTLSTTASKCVDIKPIDKSSWTIQSVAIPDALIHEPKSCLGDESIKEIYMDIDNSDTNVSVEAGEILEDKFASIGKKEKAHKVNKEVAPISAQDTSDQEVQKVLCNSPAETNQKIEVSDVYKDLPEIVYDDKPTKNIVKDQCQAVLIPSMPQIDEHENSVQDHKNTYIHKIKKDRCKQITTTEMAMVQDDLELSDETSDNFEPPKHIEKQFKPQKHGLVSAKAEENLNSESNHNFNIASVSNVNDVGVTITDQSSENDGNKKHKHKRRKTKSKEKELGDEYNDIKVSDKKTKPKKEVKPKHIKNKFTDLFGESSSLITPEDLGIPSSCVPLCEDAQDAVDINLKEIVSSKSPDNNITHDENVQVANLFDNDKRDKVIAKTLEEHVPSTNKLDTNIIYKNLNAEIDSNKPDVVKTVIISSGVQPQFKLQSDDIIEKPVDITNAKNVNKEDNLNKLPHIGMDFSKQITIAALATSTPHKEFHIHNTVENNYGNDSKSESIETKNPVVQPIQSNTQEPAPDVRIFVRRRKKAVKKT